MELEQYELAIEDQAYPFEEKAITVHEDNLKLIALGVYNEWIEKSLQKLAEFVPARYDKPEESSGIISSLDTYVFAIERPAPPESEVVRTEASEKAKDQQAEEPLAVEVPETAGAAQAEEPAPVELTETAKPVQVEYTERPEIDQGAGR